MPINELFAHWGGALSEVITVFGQDIQIDMNTDPADPLEGLHIHAVGWAGTPVFLPNSTNSSPAWDTIPGTNPALQVRQDGHFARELVKIRQASNTFLNVAPVHANITLGSVPAGTLIQQSGVEIRMRGFLIATGVVASGAVLANINTTTHRPLVNKSTGVRYTGGSSRLQVMASGDITIGSALALNDQVWLDGVTYDLLS